MKKILVLSDSHGNMGNMIHAVRLEEPDAVIHLGDGWNDVEKLIALFPNIPVDHVPGNCDSVLSAPSEKILFIEGYKILICHGHNYRVKSSYLTLELAAKEKGVDIALFGHTHQVFYEKNNGILMMNPGSIGSPSFFAHPSYGLLFLDETEKIMNMDVKYIEMSV